MTDKANSSFPLEFVEQLTNFINLNEKDYIDFLQKENSKQKQALEEKQKKVELQEKTIVRQENRITLLEELLEGKEKQIEELRNQNMVSPHGDARYDFKVNITDFSTDSLSKVYIVCYGLIELANYVGTDGNYLISCQVDVAAVYLVLNQADEFDKTSFQYIGKMKAFCDFWNTCILPYVDNNSHALLITANYDTIKNVVSKVPFKGRLPKDWRFAVQTAKRNKEALVRAINIKARIVNSLIGK